MDVRILEKIFSTDREQSYQYTCEDKEEQRVGEVEKWIDRATAKAGGSNENGIILQAVWMSFDFWEEDLMI